MIELDATREARKGMVHKLIDSLLDISNDDARQDLKLLRLQVVDIINHDFIVTKIVEKLSARMTELELKNASLTEKLLGDMKAHGKWHKRNQLELERINESLEGARAAFLEQAKKEK